MRIYDNKTSKHYPDLNPTASQEAQVYRYKELTEIEAYFLDETEVCEWLVKKDETIQCSHKYRGCRSNNINSYYWSGFYCHIFKWH